MTKKQISFSEKSMSGKDISIKYLHDLEKLRGEVNEGGVIIIWTTAYAVDILLLSASEEALGEMIKINKNSI